MTADHIGWVPVYDGDGFPTEMRYSFAEREPRERQCPRTWPHPAHTRWRTGEIVPAFTAARAVFDCPGLPMTTSDGREVQL